MHTSSTMCVYVCVQNLPFQIIPPSFFSLSPSLSLTLSLSLCLRPSASQSSREKEKKEKNLKQIHVTCQPVHGCISNMSRMANILFFLVRVDRRVSFSASFFPSFLPPPLCCAGWMDGWSQKQTGVASGAEKKDRRASRAAGAAHVCDASPAL